MVQATMRLSRPFHGAPPGVLLFRHAEVHVGTISYRVGVPNLLLSKGCAGGSIL